MQLPELYPIKSALISVSDKSGLLELASALAARQVSITSSGGTAKYLRDHGFVVRDVEDVTQFPEMLGGRLKTLHPALFGPILARRNSEQDASDMAAQGFDHIDLVVVNLYPFEQAAQNAALTPDELIEHIDIGGPSLLRAAAKNHEAVSVLCDPSQYAAFMATFSQTGGTTLSERKMWALQVYKRTQAYDYAIMTRLSEQFGLDVFDKPLRYGENPHQSAGVRFVATDAIALAQTPALCGKALSYNNLLDANAALITLRYMMDHQAQPWCGAAIIKHGSPCGAALATTLSEAFTKALEGDPLSAFGGIVALSEPVDETCARMLSEIFFEVVLAPGFTEAARDVLASKKQLRLLAVPNLMTGSLPKQTLRSINGGILVQDHDTPYKNGASAQVATQTTPSSKEREDLDLAFRLSIACPSNAITLVKNRQLIGQGSGQTSRVDAVGLAIHKAKERGFDVRDAAMGSDAFFPFADGVVLAAQAGITSVIQPGGSVKDADVIAAANLHGLSMLMTGERHFRH